MTSMGEVQKYILDFVATGKKGEVVGRYTRQQLKSSLKSRKLENLSIRVVERDGYVFIINEDVVLAEENV